MKITHTAILSLALVGAGASAQDPDEPVETLDLTMTLMPDGANLPEAVTRLIELPAAVVEAASENSAEGLGRANAAREQRESGLETAADAGEQGRERAQQAREDIVRGGPDFDLPPGPPEVPGDMPTDLPGPPELPGPPGN